MRTRRSFQRGGDRLHPVEQLLLPFPQLRVLSAGIGRRGGFRGHGDHLDLDFFLGLDDIGLLLAPLVVGRGRREEEVVCLVARWRGRFPFTRLPRTGGRIGLLPGGVARLPLLPVAFDGPPMDRQTARERLDRRQQPLLKAHDEQAGGRLGLAGGVGVWACRFSRAVRYSSSRRDSSSSGASGGSPSMTTRSTRRSGKPPCVARMSSFRRRTITSSSAFRPRTFTPRVNR